MDRTGKKVATASEKGTVIRVFSIPEGKRLFEFRRGVARCATISSLNFSPEANFLSVSSNTQTIHIFKLVNVQEQVDLNISEPILTLFEELKRRTKQ
jgi:autophagy-related protein 18